MARRGTGDVNAERAVRLYSGLMASRGWGIDRAWLGVSLLLMTCEVWRDGSWRPLFGAPVVMESNNYKLTKAGKPNRSLQDAFAIRQILADELDVNAEGVCAQMGLLFREPEVSSLQPNNIRGHAFRSIVAETIARFGDPELEVLEEEPPRRLFPGFDFGNRSKDARIDIVVKRGPRPVALITTRWTYRHDRVDIIDEARAYMPAARQINQDCRFFGATAEFGSARLKKVIDQTEGTARNAAISRLVHLNPALPSTAIGRNGDLGKLWSLEQMVADSKNWR